MNLGKLLGAGKSIFGGQEPAEYRENRHVYLPKFNVDRNPFTSKAPQPAAAVAVPEIGTQKTVVSAAVIPTPAPAPASKPVAPVPVKSVFSEPPQAPVKTPAPVADEKPSVKPAAKPARSTNWGERLNQLWAAAKPAPQAAPAPSSPMPMPNVQPELLKLDAVKVVHNDLSDADVDVEVVPMKSRTVDSKVASMPAVAMDFASGF